MNSKTDTYQNPLCTRYASQKMQHIFSPDTKFGLWRQLWIALAQSQQQLGLDITDEQISEMQANAKNINYDDAQKFEEQTRHDVMAHILAFGQQCPKAKPIIHLGATSCYVGDNADILIMRDAMLQIKKLLINVMDKLAKFCQKHKNLACLSYTHFQAAQPTTLGKRATLWLLDLETDLNSLEFILNQTKLLGARGATGTAAGFLQLFDGNTQKTQQLDQLICQKFGVEAYPVSGQTYPRKTDYNVLSVLSSIAQSAHKFSNDIRLLCHLKQADEPFETSQVGSSAMPYKKNPMRSERIASLARYVICTAQNPALTAAQQWFERTLDDSANKRIAIPQAFLATDAILLLYFDIIDSLTVYPKVIENHLQQELPFMATESILMHCVKKGGDRQILHEALRKHSFDTAKDIKENGGANNLVDRIANDGIFGISKGELQQILEAKNFTGLAEIQTQQYIDHIKTIIDKNKDFLGIEEKIKV